MILKIIKISEWWGRNWYEGKTALEIAQYKYDEEKRKYGQELPDEHRYRQILDLMTEVDMISDIGAGDKENGRTHTKMNSASVGLDADTEHAQTDLVVAGTSEVIGNEEDGLGLNDYQ